jgi:hypothetical protein
VHADDRRPGLLHGAETMLGKGGHLAS